MWGPDDEPIDVISRSWVWCRDARAMLTPVQICKLSFRVWLSRGTMHLEAVSMVLFDHSKMVHTMKQLEPVELSQCNYYSIPTWDGQFHSESGSGSGS